MVSNKPILKNILSIGSARAISMLFSLLILPYLINQIGIAQYGVIVFALAFVAYFKTLVNFSFNITAVRSISTQQKDLKQVNIIVNEIINTKLFLLLFSTILGLTVILVVPNFNAHLSIFLIIFSTLIGYALYPEWFFIGTERMEYIALLMISFKILHVISVFLFINNPTDSYVYAIILSAEQLLLAITGLILMYRKFKMRWITIPFSKIRNQLRANSALFMNQLLPNLFNNTATLLLGLFHGPAITGTFGIIRKFTNPGKNVLKIVSRVFFPAINRNPENASTFRSVQWKITFVVMITIGAIAPFLSIIFKGIDESIAIPLMILASGIIGLTLYDIYGDNYFLVKHEDQLVLKNTFIFSILGFIAAFPVIYFGGLLGAVSIVAGTQIAIGSRLFVIYKRNQHQ